ncbi:lipase family protein [Pseudoteredinibacter isoporae]|uniref:Fungal lipase-type domain-containing protein n=1 Tax=Pseudoteredinibacter isoporae TaxID=570281 RepID=A0A7X0JWY5_9GAMM|nr:lipase family protein [Pseudoteredinibacter isoporae]MBB6523030.1 hypothetical protein [Pseudoteredinibacter isoporae]NHO88552.1 lipase family protein [Pseudoteredinibacter isoporae]NIB22757.1 lipase family protein [Pseudoteredinibacter isoporae]
MVAMDMLDAFIGLITIFLVLSLIVSAMVEILAIQLGKLHSKNLKAAITTLTDSNTRQAIYAHARIRALSRPVEKPEDEPRGPSQMKDTTFVFCLLDTLVQGKYSYLRNKPLQLHEALQKAGVNEGASGWKKEIFGMWQESTMEISRFEASLCLWFGDCIDRSIGWFKRKLNVYLLAVGFVVACAVNADTLHIFQRLMEDPYARQAHVQIAEDIAQRPEILKTCVAASGDGIKTTDSCEKKIKSLVIDLGPVVGWSGYQFDSEDIGGSLFLFILKIPGFILTAFATSLGAPFWFDLLKKLLGVRRRLRGDKEPEEQSSAQHSGDAQPAQSRASLPGTSNTDHSSINNGLRRLPVPESKDIDFSDFDSFNGNKAGYNAVNLCWAAKLSELSYKTGKECQEEAKNWGLKAELLEHGATDTQCLLTESAEQKVAIIAFRGTETKAQDMLTDARFLQKPASWMPANGENGEEYKIHTGFAESLDAIWPQLKEKLTSVIAREYKLVFCGHSLGGALSILAAHRLTIELQNHEASPTLNISAVFTFGQPRVGNESFMEDVEKKLYGRYIRSVNNRDVIAMLPPPRLPDEHQLSYVHAGKEIYFNDNDEAVLHVSNAYKAMDRLSLNYTTSKEKLKELGEDHRMTNYIKLYSQYFSFTIDL